MKRKRIPRPARCPTMVAMHLAPEVETTERMALEGFLQGWAGEGQFNILADCRDLLTLAAARKNDAPTLLLCDVAGQWGIFALAFVYAASWWRGVRYHWLKKPSRSSV